MATDRFSRAKHHLSIKDIVYADGAIKRGNNGDCPICGAVGRFTVYPTQNRWQCHACDLGGDVVDYLVHAQGMTEVDALKSATGDQPLPDSPVPRPTPRQAKDEFPAAGYTLDLEAFATLQADSNDIKLASWLHKVRGFAKPLAKRIAALDCAWVRESPRTSDVAALDLARVFRSAFRVGFPLYSSSGDLVRIKRRNVGENPERKVMEVPAGRFGRVTLARGFYGSIPTAIAEVKAGKTVYITEGEIDTYLAMALFTGSVVVGAATATDIPVIAEHIREGLGADIAHLDVVLVPHQGDTKDIGVIQADKAAHILRRARSISTLTVPPGDLADVISTEGEAWLDSNPTQVESNTVQDAQRKVLALMPSLMTGNHVLEAQTGAGKSYAHHIETGRRMRNWQRVQQSLRQAPDDLWADFDATPLAAGTDGVLRIVSAQTNALAEEQQWEFTQQNPGVPTVRLQRRNKENCVHAELANEVARVDGDTKAVCEGCEHKSKCREKTGYGYGYLKQFRSWASNDHVVFGTHAMVTILAGSLGPDVRTHITYDEDAIQCSIGEVTISDPALLCVDGGLTVPDEVLGRLAKMIATAKTTRGPAKGSNTSEALATSAPSGSFVLAQLSFGALQGHIATAQSGDPAGLAALRALPSKGDTRALVDACERGWSGCWVSRDGIQIETLRGDTGELVQGTVGTLIMDATAHELATAIMIPDATHHEVTYQDTARVTHVKLDATPANLRKEPRLAREFERLLHSYDSDRTLMAVSRRQLRQGMICLTEKSPMHLEGHVHYHGASQLTGSNEFKHCDTIVATANHKPQGAIQARAETFHRATGRPMEECEEAATWTMQTAQLIQAVGRPRGEDGSRRDVVLVMPKLPNGLTADRTINPKREADINRQAVAKAVAAQTRDLWAHSDVGPPTPRDGSNFGANAQSPYRVLLRGFVSLLDSRPTPSYTGSLADLSSRFFRRQHLALASAAEKIVTLIRTSLGGRANAVFSSTPLTLERTLAVASEMGATWVEWRGERRDVVDSTVRPKKTSSVRQALDPALVLADVRMAARQLIEAGVNITGRGVGEALAALWGKTPEAVTSSVRRALEALGVSLSSVADVAQVEVQGSAHMEAMLEVTRGVEALHSFSEPVTLVSVASICSRSQSHVEAVLVKEGATLIGMVEAIRPAVSVSPGLADEFDDLDATELIEHIQHLDKAVERTVGRDRDLLMAEKNEVGARYIMAAIEAIPRQAKSLPPAVV